MRGGREHQRTRVDHVREYSWIFLRIRRNLGNRDVPGSPYEFPELPVCHGIAVHPEAVHGDAMRRGFFGIMLVRSHAKSAAGYPDQPLGLRGGVINGSIGLGRNCRKKRRHFRALPPDRSPNKGSSRATLRSSPLTGYWTVVQHRTQVQGGGKRTRWPKDRLAALTARRT